MVKKFKRLWIRIREMDMANKEAAIKAGMTAVELSNRMTKKVPWSLAEAYRMCEALEIPLEQLAEYFPPHEIKDAAR